MFEFTRSFVEALLIVLGVSFVSLGWRTGIVVATSVPLVLAIVFVAMAFLGLDLQRVTLGALIIALGLLVDDAIIAVEMMVVKLEQGWDRERAASFAWTSTAFPMLTGTLVTATGFLPIGLANSAVGEYAGGIFWVVGIALVASWFVAVIFTPFLGAKLLPDFTRRARHADPSAIYDTRFYRAFRRAILTIFPAVLLIASILTASHSTRGFIREISYAIGGIMPSGTSSSVLTFFEGRKPAPVRMIVTTSLITLWTGSGVMISWMEGFPAGLPDAAQDLECRGRADGLLSAGLSGRAAHGLCQLSAGLRGRDPELAGLPRHS